MSIAFTRFEVEGLQYPHSGIVCGGAEFMESITDRPFNRPGDLVVFHDLIDALGESEVHGINPPDFKVVAECGKPTEDLLCFFTNEGLQRCKPLINEMLDILRRNGAIIDTLHYIADEPIDENIVYQDKYQAVIYWRD